MKVTDFLRGRDVERQAVTRYINRHPEIFAGHITKDGKELELDEVAVDALGEVYPLIVRPTVVNGVSHEEYQQALRDLADARALYAAAKDMLAIAYKEKAELALEAGKVKLLEENAAEQKQAQRRAEAAIEQAATTEAKLRQECSDAADLAAKERAAREATEARLNALPKWKQRLIGWKGE